MCRVGSQVRDPQSKTPCLIFEYVNNSDFKVCDLASPPVISLALSLSHATPPSLTAHSP